MTTTGEDEALRNVLLLGDTHGNLPWVDYAIKVAGVLGCDRILQLGDFGLWTHTEGGRQYVKGVMDRLEAAGIDMRWVDGNHENHDHLAAQKRDAEGIWHLGRLTHAARGSSWEWGGKRFLACGGAYSIDKEYRTPGESWWPGELITQDDVDLCTDGGVVDVLVTHDAPAEASDAIPPDGTWDRQKDRWPESKANREQVSAIAEKVLPKLIVHGHYHRRYSQTIAFGGWETEVEGFGCDGDWIGAMGLLDLRTLRVQSVDAMPALVDHSGRSDGAPA